MFLLQIGAIFGFIVLGSSVKFPSDIPRCKTSDYECIADVATHLLNDVSNGHPGLNLIALDPLHIPAIVLKQGSDSPVNIELKFQNVDLIGLKHTKVYKVSGFNKDPNGDYEIRFKGPVVSLIGPYKISGRVLILPIQGAGQSNVTLVNPDFLVKFNGGTYTKNNKIYLQPENFKLTFDISRLNIQLNDLYNGDQVLSNSTNLFLNENWKDIFSELKKSIFDAFALIIENVVSNVCKKIPYKELFSN